MRSPAYFVLFPRVPSRVEKHNIVVSLSQEIVVTRWKQQSDLTQLGTALLGTSQSFYRADFAR